MTDLEKEADNVASLQYDYGSAYNGYLAGANRVKDTRLYSQEVIDSYEEQIKSLREQLAKERELRKELVEMAIGLLVKQFPEYGNKEFSVTEIRKILQPLQD